MPSRLLFDERVTPAAALDGYQVVDGAVVRSDNMVAIHYHRQNEHVLYSKYAFQTKAMGVCLSWVTYDDVQKVLAELGGCCGQMKPGIYTLATPENVVRWVTNNGR